MKDDWAQIQQESSAQQVDSILNDKPTFSDRQRHKDEYSADMQEAGEALGLFNDDGTLKSLNQILNEGFEQLD